MQLDNPLVKTFLLLFNFVIFSSKYNFMTFKSKCSSVHLSVVLNSTKIFIDTPYK